MDQRNGTATSLDSTMLVTITVGQLRELIRDEIQAASTTQHETDRLLTAEDAAEMLSMSTDWLYRNAKKLPFTRNSATKCSGLASKESSNGLRVESQIDLLTYICRNLIMRLCPKSTER